MVDDAGRTSGRSSLLLLGDQIYADDPSDEIVARLREAHASNTQRDPEVRDEIQNFEEYTWLYHEAWTPGRRALAAVDRAERHAARRPRPAGRLEHVDVLAPLGRRRSLGGRTG